MADWSGGEAEDKIACFQAITGVDDLDLAVSSFTSNPDPITNFNFNSLTSPTTSQPYDSMDSPPPPPHPPESSTIAWKLVNLPFYAVSGGVNLISGAIGIGFWIAGGVLSRSLNLLGLLPPHSGGNIRATEGFKVCNSLKTSRFPFCAVVMASTNQRIVMLSQDIAKLESTPASAFRRDTVKYDLAGVMRGLRGISMEKECRRTYRILSDWLYPSIMTLLLKAFSHWTDVSKDPERREPVPDLRDPVPVPEGDLVEESVEDLVDPMEATDMYLGIGEDSDPEEEDPYADEHEEEWEDVIFVVGEEEIGRTKITDKICEVYGGHPGWEGGVRVITHEGEFYFVSERGYNDLVLDQMEVVRGIVLCASLRDPLLMSRFKSLMDNIRQIVPLSCVVVVGTQIRWSSEDSLAEFGIREILDEDYAGTSYLNDDERMTVLERFHGG